MLSVLNICILAILISRQAKLKSELKNVSNILKRIENLENRVKLLREKGVFQ
jgi:hypothetical protein